MKELYKSRWMRVRETKFEYIEQICAICGKKHAPLGIGLGKDLRLRHIEYYKYSGIWFCNKNCKTIYEKKV
jgi:hypothetical protein